MDLISEHPPYPVKRPVMYQNWESLTFLHRPLPPEVVRRLLPQGLELDTYDGAAWIGLTPFLLTGLRPPRVSALPWISRFPEMNVRTYVRGPDGERGIWFFSLEADRLAAVVGARLLYRLPYRWAAMRVHRDIDSVTYQSRRHFGSGEADIAVRVGAAIRPDEHVRFLTARFRLYTRIAGRLAFAQVDHVPWPLHEATLEHFHENVVEHSGLPRLAGRPLVHFSPGVHVRVGRPTLVRGIV